MQATSLAWLPGTVLCLQAAMQVGMPLLPVSFAMPSIDQIWLMRSIEGIVLVCERLVTLLPCRKWVETLSGGMAFWCCQAIVVLSVDFW